MLVAYKKYNINLATLLLSKNNINVLPSKTYVGSLLYHAADAIGSSAMRSKDIRHSPEAYRAFMKEMIRLGADVTTVDCDGLPCWVHILLYEHTDMDLVKRVLDKVPRNKIDTLACSAGEDWEKQYKEYTWLMVVVSLFSSDRNSLQKCRMLLQRGADPRPKCSPWKTVLEIARARREKMSDTGDIDALIVEMENIISNQKNS